MGRFFELTKAILIIVPTVFVVTVSTPYFMQDALIFPAPNVATNFAEDENFKQVSISTPDGEKLFALHHPSEEGEATILVFHGNGDAAVYQKAKGAIIVHAGFGVLLVEYRGYPGSTGKPSEAGLYIDARAAYDFVIGQKKQSIGLYAHSLGTGVAVKLATERDVFSLVLESPYDSLMAVAQGRFPWMPVSLLLKHKFRSDLLMRNVKVPVLMMHGDQDAVIPVAHGRRLHESAGTGARFMVIKGAGHNNLASFATSRKAVEFFNQALN